MTQIASTVNQEATAPTSGGTEYNLWLQYMNRAFYEWAEASDWEVLRKRYYPAITDVGQATISLPFDFKKLAAAPIYYGTGFSGGEAWPENLPEEEKDFDVTSKFFTVRGDPTNGWSLLWNPATLASGASIRIEYFSTPTSLASPGEFPIVQDPSYLVDRTIAFIFESRSDSRFQEMESKAREKLLLMIDNQNTAKFSSYANPNYVGSTLRRSGFRVGRD